MTNKEAAQLVGIAAANFPLAQEKNLGPTAALWQKMLADVDYKTAEKALLLVLANARYFPTIAEIREAVVKLSAPALPSPLEAWDMARRAAHKYNPYVNNGHPPDPWRNLPDVVRQTAERIGIGEFMNVTVDDLPFLRSQFCKAYQIEAGRMHEEAVVGNLVPLPRRQMVAIDGGREKPVSDKYADVYLT